MLKHFEDDMLSLGMNKKLHAVKMSLYEDYVLLGEYGKAKALNLVSFNGKREKLLSVVCRSRTGWCCRKLLQVYLLLKYQLLKKKLNV